MDRIRAFWSDLLALKSLLDIPEKPNPTAHDLRIAQKSALGWCKLTQQGWKPYQYIKIIDWHLYRAIHDEGPRKIIVEMPPQHGKTQFCSVGWPTWFYGNQPDLKVAVASYNATLASEFSKRAREAFDEWGMPVFGRSLAPDYRAKDAWKIAGSRGSYRGVGVGGSLTGFEAHVIVIDDPYKSYEEALSPTIREKVWAWYQAVATTRMHRAGIQVIIHTRWVLDDLIGKLRLHALERPDEFVIVSFPAIAEHDEHLDDGTLFRTKGDPLCADLHPQSQLDEIKATLSKFQWQALYQQNPTTPDGTYWPDELFKDIFVPGLPPEPDMLVVGIDTSVGRDQSTSDYVAAVACATNRDGKIYVDCWIDKKNPTSACAEIAEWMAEKLPRFPDVVGTDSHGYQELYAERLATAMRLRGISAPVVGIDHENAEKTKRIQRLDPAISSRMFRFCQTRHCGELLNQLKYFPRRDVHDDGPDALEMAQRILCNIGLYL